MRTAAPATALLLALAGCSPGYMQASGLAPDAKRLIEVSLPIPPDSAARVVQARATRGGWVVTDVKPGLLIVGPYRLPEHQHLELTLRANVAPDSAGSVVVVSGTVTDHAAVAAFGRMGAAQMTNRAITEATTGQNAWTWAELRRFVTAIEGESP